MNFSPEKLLLVGVIALVVLGPHRLPKAARTLGRVVAEMRRISTSFQSEVGEALAEPREALTSAVSDLGLTDVRRSLHDGITGAVLGGSAADTNGWAGDGVSPNGSGPSSDAEPAEQSAASTEVGAAGAVIGAADVPPAPEDPSLN